MASKKLYFIALIPPEELKARVKALKEKIRDKYGAKHALKLPAHITLQPPFSLFEEQETEVFAALNSSVENQDSFPVHLSGFGSFPPKVIFIKVKDQKPVKDLHANLQFSLADLVPGEKEASIHPHMTLASRDLKRKEFKDAWGEFEKREFQDLFLAESLFLLKHNGKSWDIIREFPFFKKLIQQKKLI